MDKEYQQFRHKIKGEWHIRERNMPNAKWRESYFDIGIDAPVSEQSYP